MPEARANANVLRRIARHARRAKEDTAGATLVELRQVCRKLARSLEELALIVLHEHSGEEHEAHEAAEGQNEQLPENP